VSARHPLCAEGCRYAFDVDVWPYHECGGECWYLKYRLDEEPPEATDDPTPPDPSFVWPSDKEKQG
jgi:hypothetical protein